MVYASAGLKQLSVPHTVWSQAHISGSIENHFNMLLINRFSATSIAAESLAQFLL